MSPRRRFLRPGSAVCVVLVAVLAVLSLGVGTAVAAQVHAFSFASGGEGSAAGDLSLAASPVGRRSAPGSGLAVNDSTHEVYVADTGNRRVDEFALSGGRLVFVRAWGWGVATGAEKLEVCTSSCRAGLSGSQPGEFETPVYVAVDNSATSASKGDVYVGDFGDNLVTKFSAEGGLESAWGNNGENAKKEHVEPNGQLNGSPSEVFNHGQSSQLLGGLTVDPSGNLWVDDTTENLFEFRQEGAWLATCIPHNGGLEVGGIAADGSSIVVNGGFRTLVTIRAGCGAVNGTITAGSEETKGFAVDSSGSDIYVDREGARLEDFPATCRPSSRGCQPTQVFGEEPGLAPPPPIGGATGVAVDPGLGEVYVANTATQQVAAFGVVLEADAMAATEVGSSQATLNGSLDPEGTETSSCVFEYGATLSYGMSVPCGQSPGQIGNGNAPVPVTATVNGLSGGIENSKKEVTGTEYHYRLHASSARGSVYSEDQVFLTSPSAVLKSATAGDLTGSSATLEADVNTAGISTTTYHFEWGKCDPVAGCVASPYTQRTPEPDGTVTAGTESKVSQPIVGLKPAATYHFRVVVSDANGTVTGPEITFVYEPAANACSSRRPAQDAYLPDCRVYELVTPTAKDGALIDNLAFSREPLIAANGSRVIARSIQCFYGSPSCIGVRDAEGEPYAFERTATGWETVPLAPPATALSTLLTYNPETDIALYGIAPVAGAQEQIYARTPDGELHAIGPITETPLAPIAAVGALTSAEIATSPDLSTVVYGNTGLWPSLESGATGRILYEYHGVGNSAPTLVAVSDPAAKSLISACGSLLGGTNELHEGALSEDARTVFFSVNPCSKGTGENASKQVPVWEIYARIEQAVGMKTVSVSGLGAEAECHTLCKSQAPADAAFQGASTDGSRVYFTSTGQLTDSASEDKHNGDSAYDPGCSRTWAVATGCNLYEYECPNHCEDLSKRHLVDVSAGDMSGLGPRVQGVLAIARDGSAVYFAARGVLTGANAEGRRPVPGGENLYAYRAGSGGTPGQLAFVATLAASDATQWTVDHGVGFANVTSDGRYLLFTSHKALTPDATGGEEGPAQIYRYDAQTESLLRVSIGRNGYDDNGNNTLADAAIVPAESSMQALGQGEGRGDPSMSDDGQLVFFESPTGLVPGALSDQHVTGNTKVLAENVYEWAADGARTSAGVSCETPTGCVSLISDGKDTVEGSGAHRNLSAVQLLGTDASGENVFFWTADQLVPGDTDTQVDLYDARIGGGFPEPASPLCEPGLTLSGGGCRSAGSAPGLFGGPVSVTFSGPGNAVGETGSSGKPTPRGLTRAQKLKRALAACRGRYRSKRSRGKRAVCERQARQRYRTNTTVGSGRRRKAAWRRGRKGR